jgi:hypothetical protein
VQYVLDSFNYEESSSFLKKRTKKLLLLGARAVSIPETKEQKSFAELFQKRPLTFLNWFSLTAPRSLTYMRPIRAGPSSGWLFGVH